MNPQQKFTPKNSSTTEIFDRDAAGKFRYGDYELRFMRDTSFKFNIALTVLCTILVLCMVYVTLTVNFKTYVVRVNEATGQIESGQQLRAVAYEPREAEIKYFLTEFIKKIRTIPLDPVVYRTNWNTAQHFITTEASQKLNALIAPENPLEKLGKQTVQVQIRSITLQPGTRATYQVRWTENEFGIGGGQSGERNNYVALFSVAVNPPTNEDILKINPLGLVIKDLDYSKESDSQER